MKNIPLNSLVLIVGPNYDSRLSSFNQEDHLLKTELSKEIFGIESHSKYPLFESELYRTTELRLSLGRRVVIPDFWNSKNERMEIAKMAIGSGYSVFYIQTPDDVQDLSRGDHLAEVVGPNDNFQVIQPAYSTSAISDLKKLGFTGITAIADIHGMYDTMTQVIRWGQGAGHYLIFLGDIVDYGRHSLKCIDHIYQMVIRGEAEVILGNHERKIRRWIQQYIEGNITVSLSEGNLATTRAIEELSNSERTKWIDRFESLWYLSRFHRTYGDFAFAHAAVHPSFFDSNLGVNLHKDLESLALFGQIDKNVKYRSDGYPNRIYDWVNNIPSGKTAIVGHDIRGKLPLTQSNSNGGSAIFLDTGCGKGGKLSGAHMKFTADDNMELQSFITI